MLTVASFNVNSIKARLPRLLDWLERRAPDVAVLQETKCTADSFPHLEIEAAGYRAAVVGQKTYNGVALLSRLPFEVSTEALPGDAADTQARYVEAVIDGRLRVGGLYLPNGNPLDSDKYTYKLAWMARLTAHAQGLVGDPLPTLLGGDYNVIPGPEDVHDPAAWRDDALFTLPTRKAFRGLLFQGWTDTLGGVGHRYTFWDYQRGAWSRDQGIRIDHLLLNPAAADRLEEAGIDRDERGRDKASDHVPVWCRLAL
ncbi:exodeoxyribonuclease III [Roseospirillum parvum]|uniref:Exodeoxyribonuclease-3 n=1 Tax=Roseospirillum parvum TaxID=83401 RepID=A0A1G7YJ18_9PROT|nr:exodeoxyribonuclease III [Roseospirillum parvum]SDG96473.1 exodeoxyribonuclease-3 [Roseospirillum parvum]